jgi:hypothetical protein
MSAEERRKILQMVVDGKSSADASRAATLMRSLEESAGDEIQLIEAVPASGGEQVSALEFDQIRERARLFAWIPLGVGIVLTILTSWWMFSIQQKSGLNFWFFCMTLPFLLGVFLIALSGASRWLYVNVDRSRHSDGPENITLAFPLPLGLAGWFLKNFGSRLQWEHVDEILTAVAAAKTATEPLIVNVDGGERVQVFIG